jgi:hypothetical protein
MSVPGTSYPPYSGYYAERKDRAEKNQHPGMPKSGPVLPAFPRYLRFQGRTVPDRPWRSDAIISWQGSSISVRIEFVAGSGCTIKIRSTMKR